MYELTQNMYFRYGDGVSWHDAACYRTKQFVCEDSDKMVIKLMIWMGDMGIWMRNYMKN